MIEKSKWKRFTAFALAACILGGCSLQKEEEKITLPEKSTESSQDASVKLSGAYSGIRPILINHVEPSSAGSITPCVEPYTVEPGLSNIDNLWQFYWLSQGGRVAEKFAQNGFVVYGDAGREFFEIYETNRYEMIPNFVTVDSLMHTYHLYFAYLLKGIEKNNLSESLLDLSSKMLENSIAQYEQLKGSEWENAAKRNVAFFTVGKRLLDDNTQVTPYVEDLVSYELEKISSAQGIGESRITKEYEDYSQYIPRGYYEGDEKLERYFKAMMWYGRIHFKQKEEDLDRSALLITKALADDAEAYRIWESIYAVTSFFAGASDDLSVCEYAPVFQEVYGENASVAQLAKAEEKFDQFHTMTASLRVPQLNSIPIKDEEENVILGFRFMGQRFTIDAAIMQKLIYSNVKQNSEGKKRMLPDVLDVPAALGSEMALRILEEQGAANYQGYSEKMNQIKTGLAHENDALWSASLYAGWLNTLRPLLEVKGEGYPVFMQNEEWLKKDLECFAGSFAELKHDTILYSKQVFAEMGGGYEEEPDDRGYAEPEPLVYERFAALADETARGLKNYGMLGANEEENLSRLSQIASQLLTISNKELLDEVLTEEEYEFIRSYGGYIEHFWYEAAKAESGSEQVATLEFPAAIVADIATDPDSGTVLEVATGNPSVIYAAIKVDGKIKVAKGSVYSFYQFPWPIEDRLTDTKWRQIVGIQADGNGIYHYDNKVQRPGWTESYRYEYDEE